MEYNMEDGSLREIIIYNEETNEVFGIIPFNDPDREMVLKNDLSIIFNYGNENHKYEGTTDGKIYLAD